MLHLPGRAVGRTLQDLGHNIENGVYLLRLAKQELSWKRR